MICKLTNAHNFILLFIVFLNNFSLFLCDLKYPEVKVNEGVLRGKFLTTKNGRKFAGFMGIPFAKPPINELRFKSPVPIEPWKGVRNATEIHAVCPQRDIYRRTDLIEGDEDCLYLNVYTPKVTRDKSSSNPLLPVMVFFHGGGWLCGGGNSLWYGPDILLDRDVVLVVTNYRLGALGFLTTGDEICPGNNGLKDQNLAMRWAKKNIEQFGGDPEKITLFGESAGGASVHFHMISPLSKGLFHGAISESGTGLCIWTTGHNNQGVKNSKKLANLLFCPTSPSDKMVECLRNIDPYKIVEQDRAFMEWDADPMIPFRPVVEPDIEGAFMTMDLPTAYKEGKVAMVPWIVGLNSEDGALRAAGIYANEYLLKELDQEFDTVAPISLDYSDTARDKDYVTKEIRKFYFGDRKIDKSSIDNIVNMYTDGWFLNCADEGVRLHKKYSKQPVYYYLFKHRGVESFTKIFGDPHRDYGVCHADELQYLFPIGDGLWPDKKFTQSEIKIVEILTNLWVNFAKTGNPTPENFKLTEKWLPVQSDDALEYFEIDTEPEMKKGLLLERSRFWRRLPYKPPVLNVKDEL